MTIRLSTGLRNAMVGSVGFAGALGGGVIEIRSGTQPTTADSPATGVLLGIVTVDGLAFTPGLPANGLTLSAPADGRVTKNTDPWRFVGLETGVAGWFRHVGNALDSGGASTTLPRMDGSIGTSGADMNLSNISVTDGVPATVDVYAFSLPAR
jgi:hypothetical protein